MRDLLGHVNALERTFEPAESGLYKHLIYAQTEYMNHSQDSGIYMICLDEMNLAHVEHYFSGFLTALEMPQDRKLVPCFDDASVSPASKFARWPLLKLPPSIRFVGTVNLDETTKQISLRVKDRANFIRLRPTDAVQGSASASDQRPRVIGPRVCLRDYRDWEGAYSLDVEMAELIDALDRHLRDLGCPISPRRREAMRRFIAAANPELCSVAEAVDLQIAQRLLPQVRGLFRSEANKSLEAIAALLSKQRHSFQESMQAVDDLRREEFGGTLFSQVATA
jgi:hypothetical protein